MKLRRLHAKVGLAACLLFAGCSVAGASKANPTTTTPPTVSYNRSCEKTAAYQPAINHCAGIELSEVQGQLTSALASDAKLFGSAPVNRVQAAWMTYRNKECALEESTYKDGTIQPLILEDCEITLTSQRIVAIREVLAEHAGD